MRKTLLGKLLNKITLKFNIDLTRFIGLLFLKGYERNKLLDYADTFLDDIPQHQEVISLLSDLQSQGNPIVLCSASLDVIIEAIAKRFGITEWYSSTLQYSQNGICLGKLETDLLGKKHINCSIKNDYIMVTDNISDYELVCGAIKSYIVLTPKNKKFWEKQISLPLHYIS